MSIRTIGPRRLGAAATVAIGITAVATGHAVASTPGSATVDDDTLTVTATNRDDRVSLRLTPGDPNTLNVDFGADGSVENHFDRRTFGAITVELLGGDDEFRIDQSGGAFIDEAVTIDAGSGDDTIDGGDGDELVLGGGGDDDVDGNRGHDTALLGSGVDSFRWDPGDGSDDVDGGAGDDRLVFFGSNAAEEMSLSPNGHRAVFLRNVGTIKMNLDGVEQLDVVALGGADTVRIDDMNGTDVEQANVDLRAGGSGDLSSDVVTVNGTPKSDRVSITTAGGAVDADGLPARTRITGSEPVDVLHINGLDGDDTIDVADGVAAAIGVTVDPGTGQR